MILIGQSVTRKIAQREFSGWVEIENTQWCILEKRGLKSEILFVS